MAVWRVLLNVSLADLPVKAVTGIDASGFERAHASTHYSAVSGSNSANSSASASFTIWNEASLSHTKTTNVCDLRGTGCWIQSIHAARRLRIFRSL